MSAVEILRVVTYNTAKVHKMNLKNMDSVLKDDQTRYFRFLLVICTGSTIAIPTTLIFFIGLIFPNISIASQSLWQLALYVLISFLLCTLFCHCYRYEWFELYLNNKSIQKRIKDNGWNNVIQRMSLQNEDANIKTITMFKRLPYVLWIANRIDKNVLWFLSKTNASKETTLPSDNDGNVEPLML
eukprot:424776_1